MHYSPTETKGLGAVERVINGQLGWIFRRQPEHDFGIDGEIEFVTPEGKASGLVLKVQVKAGSSYFVQGDAENIHFYAPEDKMEYWDGHTVPVILTLHDPSADVTYWALVNKATAHKTKKRWRISVPRKSILSKSSGPALEAIIRSRRERSSHFQTAFLAPSNGGAERLAEAIRGGPGSPETEALSTASPSSSAGRQLEPVVATGHDTMAIEAALSAMPVAQVMNLARAQLAQAGLGTVGDRANEDTALHARIDTWRDIIETNPLLAHDQFVALTESINPAATPHAFYRARSNLASAAFALGRVDEAASSWEGAYDIEPTNAHAIANLAMARLIKGRVSEASQLARDALNRSAKEKTAVAVLLQALARDPTWKGDPHALVPEGLRESPDAAIGLIEFARRRGDLSWREAALEAVKRFPDEPAFETAAAHAVLDLASPHGDPSKPLQARVPRADLEHAAQVLTKRAEAWIANGYADHYELEAYANNAAVAYRLLGDHSKAKALLDRALAAHPDLNGLFKPRAVLKALLGDRVGAIDDLTHAPPDDGEAQLFSAELTGELDPPAALAILRAVADAHLPETHKPMRWMIMASVALRIRDQDAFDEALTEIRKDSALELFAEVFEIAWAAKQDLPETEARDRMRAIVPRLAPDAPLSIRYSLAEALRRHKLWFEASEVLDGFVNLEQPDEMTLMFLAMLASARRDQRFLETLKEVAPGVREHPDVIRTAALHGFNTGDLPQAEAAAAQLVAALPSMLEPVLLQLDILARQDKRTKMVKILARDLDLLTANDLGAQLKLATYFFQYGDRLRALNFTYRLSWQHRDDRRTLMAQAFQTLEVTRHPSVNLLGDVTKVGENTAVEFTSGRERLSFIVEPDADLRRLSDKAWEPRHQIVAAAWGKGVGDTFVMPDGATAKITWLGHKFVHRARETMQALPYRFPNNPDFQRFKVAPKIDGGLDEIVAVAKAQSDAAEEAFEEYREGRATLAMLALRLGSTTLDLAEGMPGRRTKLINALGGVDDRQLATAALQASADKKGFVIDAVTFWIIWRLKAAEVLIATFGPMHVASTVFDELGARRDYLTPHLEDGLKQFGYRDGQPTMTDTSSDVVRAAIIDVEEAAAWLRANAKVTPAHAPGDLPGDLARQIGQLEFHFLDEVFIALNEDVLLLSDDQRLRKLAAELGVTRAAWTQWALAWATDQAHASRDQYIEWSVRLIEAGHSYVAVTSDLLLRAILMDEADGTLRVPNGRYRRLVYALGGRDAEPVSHLRVIHALTRRLWDGTDMRGVREFATGLLLERLVVDRDDSPTLLATLARVFANHREILAYIDGWLKGHFLIPFAAS